jgi:hypothetical protein
MFSVSTSSQAEPTKVEQSPNMQPDMDYTQKPPRRHLRLIVFAAAIVCLLTSLTLAGFYAYYWTSDKELSYADVLTTPKSELAPMDSLHSGSDRLSELPIKTVAKVDPFLALKLIFTRHTFRALAVLIVVILILAAAITIPILLTRKSESLVVIEGEGDLKTVDDLTHLPSEDSGFFSKPLPWIIGVILLVVVIAFCALFFILKKRNSCSSQEPKTTDLKLKTRKVRLSQLPHYHNPDGQNINKKELISHIEAIFEIVKDKAFEKEKAGYVLSSQNLSTNPLQLELWEATTEKLIPIFKPEKVPISDTYIRFLQQQTTLPNVLPDQPYAFLVDKGDNGMPMLRAYRISGPDLDTYLPHKLAKIYNFLWGCANYVIDLPDKSDEVILLNEDFFM